MNKKETYRPFWVPRSLVGNKLQKFAKWLNEWGDSEKRLKYLNFLEEDLRKSYRNGYEQAMKDVFDFIGFKFLYKIKDIKKYKKEADFLNSRFKKQEEK